MYTYIYMYLTFMDTWGLSRFKATTSLFVESTQRLSAKASHAWIVLHGDRNPRKKQYMGVRGLGIEPFDCFYTLGSFLWVSF